MFVPEHLEVTDTTVLAAFVSLFPFYLGNVLYNVSQNPTNFRHSARYDLRLYSSLTVKSKNIYNTRFPLIEAEAIPLAELTIAA